MFSHITFFVYDSPVTWNISILTNFFKTPLPQEGSIDYQFPSEVGFTAPNATYVYAIYHYTYLTLIFPIKL